MAKKALAACALAALALGSAACSGTAQATPPSASPATSTGGGTPSSAATATASGTAAASGVATTSQAQAGGTTAAASSVPACGNDDLKISSGYGTQSDPLQASAVVFKNISSHTCVLQGYPGAAIKDGSTVINATRVLNGERGSLPPLTSPPVVTLAPGGVSYAVLEWLLHTNQPCYPENGGGTFEITAPNTTKTVILGTGGHMGEQGICSAFEINPVVPGVFGVAVGN